MESHHRREFSLTVCYNNYRDYTLRSDHLFLTPDYPWLESTSRGSQEVTYNNFF